MRQSRPRCGGYHVLQPGRSFSCSCTSASWSAFACQCRTPGPLVSGSGASERSHVTCIGPSVGPAGIGWLAQSPHAHTAHMHAYLLTSTVCDSSTARSVDASPVPPRSLSDYRMHSALELDHPIRSSKHCAADVHALEHVDVQLALRHPRTGTSTTVGPRTTRSRAVRRSAASTVHCRPLALLPTGITARHPCSSLRCMWARAATALGLVGAEFKPANDQDTLVCAELTEARCWCRGADGAAPHVADRACPVRGYVLLSMSRS
jgi:hypothetical protein